MTHTVRSITEDLLEEKAGRSGQGGAAHKHQQPCTNDPLKCGTIDDSGPLQAAGNDCLTVDHLGLPLDLLQHGRFKHKVLTLKGKSHRARLEGLLQSRGSLKVHAFEVGEHKTGFLLKRAAHESFVGYNLHAVHRDGLSQHDRGLQIGLGGLGVAYEVVRAAVRAANTFDPT